MLAFFREIGYNKDEPRENRKSAGEPKAVSIVLNDLKEASPMNREEIEPQDERDIVEFSDEEGNTLLLEVIDYFFYNGEEYAVLCDADEEAQEADLDDDEDQMIYIMKVVSTTSEDGEEMEEFIPPEDSLLDQLIEVVQTRFTEDDDDLEDDEPEEE